MKSVHNGIRVSVITFAVLCGIFGCYKILWNRNHIPSYISMPTISPDGTKVAYLASHNDGMNIWVKDQSGVPRIVTRENCGVGTYWWSYDNQHLLYFQNVTGNENWNLYCADLKTEAVKNLTPFPEAQVRLIRYSPRYPDIILVGINQRDKRYHDVYRINIITGELVLQEQNPGYIAGFDRQAAWYADDNLDVRLAYHIDDDGSTRVLHRENACHPWQELLRWDVNASAGSDFIGFDASGELAYFADASQSDKSQLIALHLKTGKCSVLYQDPVYDVIIGALPILYNEYPSFLINPIDGTLAAIFLERDVLQTIILDDAIHADITFLQKAKAGSMRICSTDQSFNRWIVAYTHSDRDPDYYVYDRKNLTLAPVTEEPNPLTEYKRAKMEPVSFTARDGLTIHGYVTYPVEPITKPSPAIIIVHGGPWMRDTWDYSPNAQWLAYRGYVCFQINYRGSSGYGTSFVRAGNKEYGRAMQHDLTDGVQWLIEQGIADPQRIAILGWSYGGYATLAGACFTPGLYACAVDLYGMADITAEIIPPYWEKSAVVWKYRKGDPTTEQEMLRERSPIFHIDKIKTPLFIAHGAQDVRSKKAYSDAVAEELRKRNIPCTYISFTDEGHFFSGEKNRIALYEEMEKFLATYLKKVNF